MHFLHEYNWKIWQRLLLIYNFITPRIFWTSKKTIKFSLFGCGEKLTLLINILFLCVIPLKFEYDVGRKIEGREFFQKNHEKKTANVDNVLDKAVIEIRKGGKFLFEFTKQIQIQLVNLNIFFTQFVASFQWVKDELLRTSLQLQRGVSRFE